MHHEILSVFESFPLKQQIFSASVFHELREVMMNTTSLYFNSSTTFIDSVSGNYSFCSLCLLHVPVPPLYFLIWRKYVYSGTVFHLRKD